MRMYDIIQKKKDGLALTEEEIRFFTEGYTKGDIPDYQAAALCMAIYFKGMSPDETAALTFAIRDSGDKLDFSGIKGIRADKHSTGGVGDKTSLIVAPLVASCGVTVAKITGRALGHTGGTVDKLESIPGMRTSLSEQEFVEIANKVGVCMIGQSREIAPADKKLYALRDVTATVDCIPLIVSSIMGKKLAADDDCIVLDVKTGSGSFMKTLEESRTLARIMVDIGNKAGKKTMALITDMDVPLGYAIGNALEVMESIRTLKGEGPEDLTQLCIILASSMLHLADRGTIEECVELVKDALYSGRALEKFREMISAQGGNPKVIDHFSDFGAVPEKHIVRAPRSGYIYSVNTAQIGETSLLLGAGRNTVEDAIDPMAGIILLKKTGEQVTAGDPIAELYTWKKNILPRAEEMFLASTFISDIQPEAKPLVFDIIK
ncbi:MAG: thymidine phosphorylase [Lachnospiraceae bacterium]|nr:thymidine phosphorylase [Lachnospiraceae bacterium]